MYVCIYIYIYIAIYYVILYRVTLYYIVLYYNQLCVGSRRQAAGPTDGGQGHGCHILPFQPIL